MAYPFVQFPTFSELVGRLTSNEFGCVLETMEDPMMDVNGDDHSIHYLQRTVAGKSLTYVLVFSDFEERLTFSLLRSICDRLQIDPKHFGLSLN